MNTRFVIMGLPASGKTTFLAALWHLIAGGDETKCRLTLERLDGDKSYLNEIGSAWRSFTEVPRTSQLSPMDVAIQLKDCHTGISGTARFPDLAGEVYDRQIAERRCRAEFLEEISSDNGILFFISADVTDATESFSVLEFNAQSTFAINAKNTIDSKMVGEITGGDGPPPPNDFQEWEPKHLPTQVKIVQLLSDLLCPPFEPRCRRLAVMISAWDLTEPMMYEPQEWLAKEMPLVDQFLRANELVFKYRIYGVSAQGVNLKNHEAVEQLADRTPSERIQIIGPDCDKHDLTAPLVWLMSAAE
ncbi:TRAFAC clade GTPase domain-containing protein [Parachitinimonas caeni]|uniref:Double-GTPase 1 domain-containing protein n=1 Tax=Parachitinimonas caeni TaxID=3031301 RepID=A0ABT7E1N3_9NEIS|nr:hypothetical protein [Parachitinimonas caeni]MDK2126225.1 hypothetical protein [Parachitinimonas caeni]